MKHKSQYLWLHMLENLIEKITHLEDKNYWTRAWHLEKNFPQKNWKKLNATLSNKNVNRCESNSCIHWMFLKMYKKYLFCDKHCHTSCLNTITSTRVTIFRTKSQIMASELLAYSIREFVEQSCVSPPPPKLNITLKGMRKKTTYQ